MSENIETLQRSTRVIPAPSEMKAQAHIQDYETAYKASIADPEKFWEALPKNSTGFHLGRKSWSGTTPGRNGFLAPRAIFPTTA